MNDYIRKLKLVPFLWITPSLIAGIFLGLWALLFLPFIYFRTCRPYVAIIMIGVLLSMFFHKYQVRVENNEKVTVVCKIGERVARDIYEVDVIKCVLTEDSTKQYKGFKSILEFYEPSDELTSKYKIIELEAYTQEIIDFGVDKSTASRLKGYTQKLVAYPNKDLKKYVDKNPIFLQDAKTKINSRLATLGQYSNNFTLLQKMMIGNEDYKSKTKERTFKNAGIAHILAISGLHIGILYIILSISLYFMNLTYALKILKLVFIAILLFLYVWLIGFQPSAIRAAIMMVFLGYAQLKLENSMLRYNILFGTAFIMLLYDSTLLYDISFQLSFTAVAGILYGISKYRRYVNIHSNMLNYILLSCVVTLSAQIATFPLVLYYFGSISTVSVLSNMLIAPFIAPLLGLAIIYVIFDIQIVGKLACVIIDYIVEVAEFAVKIPYSSFNYIDFRYSELVAIYIAYFLIFLSIELTNKEKKLSLPKHNYSNPSKDSWKVAKKHKI
ncbi:MAG: ComEC/Rec2 family competence protein [Rikenellaceae bacterium]